MKTVCQNHILILITRSNAEPVVMLSLADYQAMEETAYLMRSPQNAARLADAINETESMISEAQNK